jgi:hypothetical protein
MLFLFSGIKWNGLSSLTCAINCSYFLEFQWDYSKEKTNFSSIFKLKILFDTFRNATRTLMIKSNYIDFRILILEVLKNISDRKERTKLFLFISFLFTVSHLQQLNQGLVNVFIYFISFYFRSSSAIKSRSSISVSIYFIHLF